MGLIKHFFQAKDPRGNASKHERKLIVDAILYIVTSGAQWRMLPKDFPPWKTVYDHFRKWSMSGVWEQALYKINSLHRKKNSEIHSPVTASLTRKVQKLNMAAKNVVSMEEKSKRTQATYCRGYSRKPVTCPGSCG